MANRMHTGATSISSEWETELLRHAKSARFCSRKRLAKKIKRSRKDPDSAIWR